MENTVKDLYTFIETAEKNRKYLGATPANMQTSLRFIENELTEEEKNSVELIEKNLEQIFTSLYSKHRSKLSASSLEIYKRRIRNLIKDFRNYGKDPAKMASWTRKVIIRKGKEKEIDDKNQDDWSGSTFVPQNSNMQSADINLTNGKGKIIVPRELTIDDVRRLKSQIDLFANIPKEDK